ncbi:MAG: outer membrane beta-barrel protein [Raineya sp.]|nr:PorT family protein [Raineya sp.]MDW8295863.1 outer membrane beta-barrel protein [Raineya sp.]
MKQIVWLLVCLIFSLENFAQDLLVLANGDTLRVHIRKAFANTNAYKLTYKLAPESTDEIILKPSQIRSFFIGNQYISLLVEKDGSTEQLLLQEILVNGRIKLYKGVDEQGNPDFFISKDGKNLAVSRENLNDFVEKHFTDCPNFSRERYLPAENKLYRQDYLMDLVSHYNHCVDDKVPYYRYYEPEKAKKRDNLSWGVKAGGGIQEYAFRSFATDANAFLYGLALFNWQISFTAGLYGSINYSDNFSMMADVSYMYRNAISEDGVIEIAYSGLNIPLYAEFKFLRGKKVRPFVNLGGNAVIAIAPDYQFNLPPNFQILRPLTLSPVSFGVMGGLGTYVKTAKNPLKFEVRMYQDFFEASNPTFGDDKMRVAGILLMISYALGK